MIIHVSDHRCSLNKRVVTSDRDESNQRELARTSDHFTICLPAQSPSWTSISSAILRLTQSNLDRYLVHMRKGIVLVVLLFHPSKAYIKPALRLSDSSCAFFCQNSHGDYMAIRLDICVSIPIIRYHAVPLITTESRFLNYTIMPKMPSR